METTHIALFGEAEKGEFHTGYQCDSLPQLENLFGHPPRGTQGLYFAIQSILYHYHLIFFRVKEEGFSLSDYLIGFKTLQESPLISHIVAIGVPGVGDKEVLEAATPLILTYHPILITSEADFYDYIMSK